MTIMQGTKCLSRLDRSSSLCGRGTKRESSLEAYTPLEILSETVKHCDTDKDDGLYSAEENSDEECSSNLNPAAPRSRLELGGPRIPPSDTQIGRMLAEKLMTPGRPSETKKKSIFSIVQPMRRLFRSISEVLTTPIQNKAKCKPDLLKHSSSGSPKHSPPQKSPVILTSDQLVFQPHPKNPESLSATIEIVNDNEAMYLAYQAQFTHPTYADLPVSSRLGAVSPGQRFYLRVDIPRRKLAAKMRLVVRLAWKKNNRDLEDFFKNVCSNYPEYICTKVYNQAILFSDLSPEPEHSSLASKPQPIPNPDLPLTSIQTELKAHPTGKQSVNANAILLKWHRELGYLSTFLGITFALYLTRLSLQTGYEDTMLDASDNIIYTSEDIV